MHLETIKVSYLPTAA